MSENRPNSVDELSWQPAGTHKSDSTMPSETNLRFERLMAKAFVHNRTSIEAREGFLILQVGDEEAIVGPLSGEESLGEFFEKRGTKKVSVSCSELLRLFEDDDPTDADKELLMGLRQKNGQRYSDEDKADEGVVFFRDLCSHINDRNLYRTEGDKGNTSLSN